MIISEVEQQRAIRAGIQRLKSKPAPVISEREHTFQIARALALGSQQAKAQATATDGKYSKIFSQWLRQRGVRLHPNARADLIYVGNHEAEIRALLARLDVGTPAVHRISGAFSMRRAHQAAAATA